jgi:hypothetical protein
MTELWCRTVQHRGHAVAPLVEALRYKPEGRGFDPRLWPRYNPEVDSASNRNENQECFLGSKGGRCVGLTTLPPSRADCREIWEPQPPGTLKACPDLYRDCFTMQYIVRSCTDRGCTNFGWQMHFARWWLISVGPMYRIVLTSAFWPVPASGGRRRYKLPGFGRLEGKPGPRLCCICFWLSRIFTSGYYNAEYFYPENGDSSTLRNVGTYPPITMFYVSRTLNLNLI